jgi:hypothetical protein
VEYIHQTVKVIRGREATKIAELQKFGWELVSENQGTIRTELAFRKVKPKTFASHLQRLASQGYATFRRLAPAPQRRIFAMVGGVIAVLAVVAVVAGMLADGDGSAPSTAAPQKTTSAPVTPSATPSPSETPTPTPTPTPTEPVPDVITAANTREFAEILKGDYCSGSIARFAKKYAGKTIPFDGSVVDVAPHGGYNTRFDYLLGPGNKGPNTTVGPVFKFENVNYGDFNMTGMHKPDSIDVGGNFRFIAEVDRYVSNTCLFFLTPVKTQTR